jgi:uncharacterized integral membrane protein
MLLRLIGLGTLVLLLAAVTVQNMTPITLVVLGAPSRSLPLSFWLIAALILGSMTSIGLAVLLQTAGLLGRRDAKRSMQAAVPGGKKPRRFLTLSMPKFSMPSRSGGSTHESWDDDEAWDGVDQPQPDPSRSAYRDPRRDKVVDAEFRVIKPPTRNLDDEK